MVLHFGIALRVILISIVEELMKNYGKVDILWYDGGWLAHNGKDADAAWFWKPVQLNKMVRSYQPNVVISPRSGWEGDFQCKEGGGQIHGPIINTPWEKCLNLNQTSWGLVTKIWRKYLRHPTGTV